jgi:hypothetical protein
VPQSVDSVFAFVKLHPPLGFHYIGGGGVYQSLDFANGSIGPRQRLLTVDLAPLAGRTVVRVEAGVAWIYPRSPQEVVPAGVREIDIHDRTLKRRIVDPAKVDRIVRWFDALNVLQPGLIVHCPLISSQRATLVFRSASGARLATAIVRPRPATVCNPIAFSIRGHRQRPLIDGASGRHPFLVRVWRLLGLPRLVSR